MFMCLRGRETHTHTHTHSKLLFAGSLSKSHNAGNQELDVSISLR